MATCSHLPLPPLVSIFWQWPLNGTRPWADGDICLEVRYPPIDRLISLLLKKQMENGNEKWIVKRVIGLPGGTIKYENDHLYQW